MVAVVGCAAEETSDNPGGGGSSGSGGSSSIAGGSGGAAGNGGSKPTSGGGGTNAGSAGTSAGAVATGGASGMGGKAGAGAGGISGGTGGAAGSSSTAGTGGTTAGTGGAAAGSGGKGGSGGSGGSSAGGGAGGSGNVDCADGVAFCDDFEDQNATGWTKSGGTWSVVQDAGDWVYEGGNASEEAYAGTATWTDQTIEANVKVTNFGGSSDSYRVGIMARRSGSSNFYVFALGGDGNLTLRKSTSTLSGTTGTCSPLAPGVATTGWFTLKMSVTGNASSVRIRTYINDQPKHDCTTTSSPLTQGQIGLLTYGSNTVAHFDDVSVTTP